jgi:hypothetical protein
MNIMAGTSKVLVLSHKMSGNHPQVQCEGEAWRKNAADSLLRSPWAY